MAPPNWNFCLVLFLSPAILLEEPFEAYVECRRNTRQTANARAFEPDYESNLVRLLEEVNSGAWRSGCSVTLSTTWGCATTAATWTTLSLSTMTGRRWWPWYRASGPFLRDGLRLTLHPRKVLLQPCRHGVPFLGMVVHPGHVAAGDRVKANFKAATAVYNCLSADHRPDRDELAHFRSSVNSYLGILAHYDTYRLRRSVLSGVNAWWWRLFRADNRALRVEVRPCALPCRKGEALASVAAPASDDMPVE